METKVLPTDTMNNVQPSNITQSERSKPIKGSSQYGSIYTTSGKLHCLEMCTKEVKAIKKSTEKIIRKSG
jgi:hypothetical protein